MKREWGRPCQKEAARTGDIQSLWQEIECRLAETEKCLESVPNQSGWSVTLARDELRGVWELLRKDVARAAANRAKRLK